MMRASPVVCFLLSVFVVPQVCAAIFSFGNFSEKTSPIYYWNEYFRLWRPYNQTEGRHMRFMDSWTEQYYWAIDSAGTLYDASGMYPVASMPSDLTGQVVTTDNGYMMGNFASTSQPEYRGIASFSFHNHAGSITPMGHGLPTGIFVHACSAINRTQIIGTSGADAALWSLPNSDAGWQPVPQFTAPNAANRVFVIYSDYHFDYHLIGGSFKTTNGYYDLVKMDRMTGAVTPAFDGPILNPGGSIRCICSFFDANKVVYVAGDFTSIGGVAASGIAKYDIEAQKFTALHDGESTNDDGKPFVVNTCYTESGQILFGGSFTKIAGVAVKNVFVLTETGSIRPLGLNSVPGEVFSFNDMAQYPGFLDPLVEFLGFLAGVGVLALLCCCCCLCLLVVAAVAGGAALVRAKRHQPQLTFYTPMPST